MPWAYIGVLKSCDFVLQFNTAKAARLSIAALLARADEVIE
jgi:hypothetical protein